MAEIDTSNFNIIIQQIIKKSLFTERQIEIILNRIGMEKGNLRITKGAYYRQVGQVKAKLLRLYYTIVLLRSIGVIQEDDLDVIFRLSEQISVIRDSDVLGDKEYQIIEIIDKVITQACKL